jgi:hypothetical protein
MDWALRHCGHSLRGLVTGFSFTKKGGFSLADNPCKNLAET